MTGELIGTIREVRIAGPGAEFLIDDEPVDVFIEAGRIVDIAPRGAVPARGEIYEAGGAYAVPGLWDHHVHSVQWALAAARLSVAEAVSAADAARRIGAALPGSDGRLIGTGYRDALWPDHPSLDVLDAATGEVPTYLINADVHSAWLNTAALRREGFASHDGVLREQAAFEISRRLNAIDDADADAAVRRAGEQAAARGITGIVDFDMAWTADAWQRRIAGGFAAHRVEFAVYPDDLDRAIAAGLRSGEALTGGEALVRVGAVKLITDGSLGTRTAACSHAYDGTDAAGALNLAPEELHGLMTRATGAGLRIAAHAIGDVAAAAVLDAFAFSGAAGTMEHAQLIRHADVARMSRLGIAASVQPAHAVDDRDLADRLWRSQTSIGYPMRTLQDAGVELRLGSDAPVAPLDPWNTIAAAVLRTADDRVPWHPEEALTVDEALRASVRGELRPGAVADIAVVEHDPRSSEADALRRMPVLATLLAGRATYLR